MTRPDLPGPSSSPRVTVVMPVRDGAEHLREAIESLEAQTFEDVEHLVIDDGSSDGTPAVLDAWRRRDPRVRVLTTPPRGLAPALNLGLAEARGEYLARMDADDVALPARLERQVAFLDAHPDVTVLGTRVEMFPRGAIKAGMLRFERWLNGLVTPDAVRRDLLVESPICHPSVMARREALLDAGGYRDFDGPEDYDLWLRLARRGAVMTNLPDVLLRWRDHGERATRVDPRYRHEAMLRSKLEHLLAGPLKDAPAVAIWGAGPWGKRWARRLVAEGRRVAFFVEVASKKIGQTIHDAPVLAVEELPPPGEAPLLVAVGVDGARALIRAELSRRGWRETIDAWCVQ